MTPLSPESICLMNALRDANGGALAVDYIVATYGRRPLTALHKRDFVSFVNYANGEHAILTNAGLDGPDMIPFSAKGRALNIPVIDTSSVLVMDDSEARKG